MRLVDQLEVLEPELVVREKPGRPYGNRISEPRPVIAICARVRPLVVRGIVSLLEEYVVHSLEEPETDLSEKLSEVKLLILCARSTLVAAADDTCHCRQAGIPIVFFSEGWLETEEAARKAGLTGYLGPECEPHHLMDAVRVVLGGGSYYHPCGSQGRVIGSLTDRQFQVLKLVGHGLTDHEMSEQIHLSEATIRHHMEGLMTRLGVTRRSELIALAALGGLNNLL